MRLWTVALIVGMGCEAREHGSTGTADVMGRREEPGEAPSSPEPELGLHDERVGTGTERAAAVDHAPAQELTPFDPLAAALWVRAGYCLPQPQVVPDEAQKCLRKPAVVKGCGTLASNGVLSCFKRVEDGALTWTGGWPTDPEATGWTPCDGDDRAKASWPACSD